ncbi:MAG: nuclear transport factor 2 family protein [Thaumarchaeota archaeon]|nr:nuclear transport factor 2 family protein [Nitrososphaerota archaeon]
MPRAKDAGKAEQVRKTMLKIYRAFEDLDADSLDTNYSQTNDLLAFGTDFDEKFSGWDRYKHVHATQFGALKSFEFRSRELEVHVHGEVAWAADRPLWVIETKDGEKIRSEVRVTAVLRWNSEKKRWLVVQWHVSSGLKERMHEY